MLTWSTFSQVPFFCFSFDTTDCLFFYLKYFSIQIFTFSYLEVKKNSQRWIWWSKLSTLQRFTWKTQWGKRFSQTGCSNLILDSSADRPNPTRKNSKRLPLPPVRVFWNFRLSNFFSHRIPDHGLYRLLRQTDSYSDQQHHRGIKYAALQF